LKLEQFLFCFNRNKMRLNSLFSAHFLVPKTASLFFVFSAFFSPENCFTLFRKTLQHDLTAAKERATWWS